MAIEQCDLRFREVWSETSRSWYRHVRHLQPSSGRIQGFLSILSTSDDFQVLLYYSKSLTFEESYSTGRDGIFDTLKLTPTNFPGHTKVLQLRFPNVHLALYTEHVSRARFLTSGLCFRAILAQEDYLSYKQRFEFAMIKIASLFNYGNRSPLRYIFELANQLSSITDLMIDEEMRIPPHLKEPLLAGISDSSNQAICCKVIFDTLRIFLQRDDYSNAVGHILASLTFLCSLEKASKFTSVLLQSSLYMVRRILDQVPIAIIISLLEKGSIRRVPSRSGTRFSWRLSIWRAASSRRLGYSWLDLYSRPFPIYLV